MAKKSMQTWTAIGLLCALTVASSLGAYYYTEQVRYQQLYNQTLSELRKYDGYIFVKILIDYGNGTKNWDNNTLVERGADILNATRIIAEVNYTLGQYGAFVTHINTVGGDPNTYWIWYIWNSTSSSWDWGPVASNAYVLNEGDIIAWIYS